MPLPFPIPTWDAARLAIAPWLMWIKIAFLAAIFAGGYYVGHRMSEAKWQHAATEQADAFQKALLDNLAVERAAAAANQETSNALQEELAQIRTERDRLRARPVRTVRLCTTPAADGVPAAAAPAGGRDGAAPAPFASSGAAGPDIGRGLYDLADDGDEREADLDARLIACQKVVTDNYEAMKQEPK